MTKLMVFSGRLRASPIANHGMAVVYNGIVFFSPVQWIGNVFAETIYLLNSKEVAAIHGGRIAFFCVFRRSGMPLAFLFLGNAFTRNRSLRIKYGGTEFKLSRSFLMNAKLFSITTDADWIVASELSPFAASIAISQADPVLLATDVELRALAQRQSKSLAIVLRLHESHPSSRGADQLALRNSNDRRLSVVPAYSSVNDRTELAGFESNSLALAAS